MVDFSDRFRRGMCGEGRVKACDGSVVPRARRAAACAYLARRIMGRFR